MKINLNGPHECEMWTSSSQFHIINQNHRNLISKNALFTDCKTRTKVRCSILIYWILNAECWTALNTFKVRIFLCRILKSGQCWSGPCLNNLHSNHVHSNHVWIRYTLYVLRSTPRIRKFSNSKNVDWRDRIFINFPPQRNIR